MAVKPFMSTIRAMAENDRLRGIFMGLVQNWVKCSSMWCESPSSRGVRRAARTGLHRDGGVRRPRQRVDGLGLVTCLWRYGFHGPLAVPARAASRRSPSPSRPTGWPCPRGAPLEAVRCWYVQGLVGGRREAGLHHHRGPQRFLSVLDLFGRSERLVSACPGRYAAAARRSFRRNRRRGPPAAAAA